MKKEMTPLEFLKYASGQIEKAFEEDGEEAGARLVALKESMDGVTETSFSSESPVPIQVETFEEPQGEEALSHEVEAGDTEALDALGEKLEELKADGGADDAGFPDDMNAEEFDENGVRKADEDPEWGADPTDDD